MMYLLMIVVAAVAAASGLPATTAAADALRSAVQGCGVPDGVPSLDKTWTTGGQENEAGSQVLVFQVLTSPVSFQAEGTGLEPATPCGAPHFQCGR